MAWKSLYECIRLLESNNQLLRIREEVDPHLEMAAIHRRVFENNGPAILYENVKGSPFPAVSNLYGSKERIQLLFNQAKKQLQLALRFKKDPLSILFKPASVAPLLHTVPLRKNNFSSFHKTTVQQLPQIKCWPGDAGAFILLPQVYSESVCAPGWKRSNLGCYRIQMSGNAYESGKELGLHFQIHRGIGNHYAEAKACGLSMKISIFVGGPPSHLLSAVMPLPENMPEVAFAGLLNGSRFGYFLKDGFVFSSYADFVITGTVVPGELKPEGPFGDHLGYYSLQHDYPVIAVHGVYHKKNAVWPFTVVGRPPQEDSCIAEFIHELTAEAVSDEVPGLRELNAVDEAGVHPLLLAIADDRYLQMQEKENPGELLTIAHRILGTGQLSLAKYLIIARSDAWPALSVFDVPRFFKYFLERVDWSRDLHFQTNTSMDTLDYSGPELNRGSKLLITVLPEKIRELSDAVSTFPELPFVSGIARAPIPGILLLQTAPFKDYEHTEHIVETLSAKGAIPQGFPLIVLTDDSEFAAASLRNFLWVAFTRSNPSHDIYGIQSFIKYKHWGCRGPLVIDARMKPHHAPVVETDPETERKVEALAAPGRPLHKII